MAAIDELRDHPHAFLRHYYLQLSPALFDPGPNLLAANGTVRIALTDITGDYLRPPTRPRRRRGVSSLLAKMGAVETVKATRIYRIVPADPADGTAISAYICPYEPGQTRIATVSGNAKLMFTAEMSGCTFGVGSPANGSYAVAHSNDYLAGNEGGAAGQQAAQRTKTLAAIGGPVRGLQPHQYREVTPDYETRATVTGIRDGLKWEFWAQRFEFDNDSMDRMKLIRFA